MNYMYYFFYEKISRFAFFKQIINYIFFGSIPEYKKRICLRKYLKLFYFKNAVESGTYFGRSTKILAKYVKNVHTIEIDRGLHEFVTKKYKNLNVIFHLGDSEEIFAKILEYITGPTIFYLDGHTSGGITGKGNRNTSLSKEIFMLGKFAFLSDSLILIDDAESINGTNDYPAMGVIMSFAKLHKMMVYKTKTNSLLLIGSHLNGFKKNLRKCLYD